MVEALVGRIEAVYERVAGEPGLVVAGIAVGEAIGITKYTESSLEEGVFSYRNKADFPYLDADGNEFDDRDFEGTGTFPTLDAATSFPYTPTFATPDDATAKAPPST